MNPAWHLQRLGPLGLSLETLSAKYTRTLQKQDSLHEEKFRSELEQALIESKNNSSNLLPLCTGQPSCKAK